MVLTKRDVYILYGLLFLVYVCGLFIPVMENDSAQHATMAMRMYVENDFWNIYKGHQDYLDKPHVHFWLAAFSFKLFGIHHWAYRIPALLFTLMGAVCTNKLAVHFYGKKINHIAALIFLSAQAVILANHDVRTDAVLTGATILAVYNFGKIFRDRISKKYFIRIFRSCHRFWNQRTIGSFCLWSGYVGLCSV